MNCCQPKHYTIILLFFAFTAFGQEEVRDTLFGKSYDELDSFFHAYFPGDTIRSGAIVDAYIAKGRAEKDTSRIARGFRYYATEFGPETGMMYSDSIIQLTQNIYHKEYPGRGYMLKGYWHYYLDQYIGATENYIRANEYAIARDNLEQQVNIRLIMAALKHVSGKYEEGLAIEKEHLYLLENDLEYRKIYLGDDAESEYGFYLIFSIYNVSLAYLRLRETDSARTYLRKGIRECVAQNDSMEYYRFVSTGGVAEYYDGNYSAAIDSFTRAIPHLENEYTYVTARLYKGMSHGALGDDGAALPALKITDSLVEKLDYLFPELRPAYEYMIKHYEKKQERDSQLVYINKLLKLDEVLLENKIIDGEIARKYDTPYLLRQKEILIDELEQQQLRSQLYKWLILGLTIAVAVLLVYYYRKQYTYKKRYRALLSGDSPAMHDGMEGAGADPGVPDEIFTAIEKGLQVFEEENRFTDPSITLYRLAGELNTNSTYLSRVINTTREVNFSTYLHGLRINHIIERLKNEEQLRRYSINGIAGEAGYNTTQSFTNSFYRYTGIHPSYFIRKLREEKLTESRFT